MLFSPYFNTICIIPYLFNGLVNKFLGLIWIDLVHACRIMVNNRDFGKSYTLEYCFQLIPLSSLG